MVFVFLFMLWGCAMIDGFYPFDLFHVIFGVDDGVVFTSWCLFSLNYHVLV
jgi:hypothetical protein